MTKSGSPLVNAGGTPKWRMAPSPHIRHEYFAKNGG